MLPVTLTVWQSGSVGCWRPSNDAAGGVAPCITALNNPQPPSALSLKYVFFSIIFIILIVIHIIWACQPAVCSFNLSLSLWPPV